jgi:hypothetical protein
MALHVWSVLCSQSITNKDTNNISLIEILEQLKVNLELLSPDGTPAPPDVHLKTVPILPIVMNVVSFWVRSDDDSPEVSYGRLSLKTPSGQERLISNFRIELEKFQQNRTINKMVGFPVSESGKFLFLVDLGTSPTGNWSRVAEIPLRVTKHFGTLDVDKL